MLKLVESRPTKQRVFQVMLLHNNARQEVEVQEDREIDFLQLWNHLEKGGSAFITSKNSQKLRIPKQQTQKSQNENDSEIRTITTYYFNHI
jgi:hypothetical protein